MQTSFSYRGNELLHLLSGYNCYHHSVNQFTERIVEIPIADWWLSKLDGEEVTEIGAVTPYYWPHRVSDVIDPFDEHPLVNRRVRLQEVMPLLDKNVLSVSTLEHIGKAGDQGQTDDPSLAWQMLGQLVFGSRRLLATWPTGYNAQLDAYAMKLSFPGVTLTCLGRQGDDWEEIKPEVRPYGTFGNAVFVIEKEDVSCL